MSLADARRLTAEYRGKAAQGTDPRPTREPTAKPLTFGEVVTQFVDKHCKVEQRTWKQTESILRNGCAAWLGKPFASVTKNDVLSLIEGFNNAGKWSKGRVTFAWLKKLFDWAKKRDILPGFDIDTCEISFKKKKREKVYSDDDIKAIWSAADKLPPAEGAYYKLLLLLCPRKSALAQMRHSDLKTVTVNEKTFPSVWVTPFELTKSRKNAEEREYFTPLPPLALRIYKTIPKHDKTDRVFPLMPEEPKSDFVSRTLGKHGIKGFAFHTARHTTSTWLEDQGYDLYSRGLVLNHSGSGTVTSGYSHGFPMELKLKILTVWAQHVEGLVTPKGAALLK